MDKRGWKKKCLQKEDGMIMTGLNQLWLSLRASHYAILKKNSQRTGNYYWAKASNVSDKN